MKAQAASPQQAAHAFTPGCGIEVTKHKYRFLQRGGLETDVL